VIGACRLIVGAEAAAIALFVGVVAFPTQTSNLFMYAVSQKAASLTKLLQHALEPAMKAAEPRPPRTRYRTRPAASFGVSLDGTGRAEEAARQRAQLQEGDRREDDAARSCCASGLGAAAKFGQRRGVRGLRHSSRRSGGG